MAGCVIVQVAGKEAPDDQVQVPVPPPVIEATT